MIRKYNIEKATTEPMVTVIANDNWIEFTIRHAVNYKRKRITKDHLFTSIPSEINQPAGKVQWVSTIFEVVASYHIKPNITMGFTNISFQQKGCTAIAPEFMIIFCLL